MVVVEGPLIHVSAVVGPRDGGTKRDGERHPVAAPAATASAVAIDRLETIGYLKKAGIKICSGGIIGMGETRADRCDLAFELKAIGANVVPVNILNPIPGTPFAKLAPLPVMELRWAQPPRGQAERLWELPEGVCIVGPAPARFGFSFRRLDEGDFAVRLLWDGYSGLLAEALGGGASG